VTATRARTAVVFGVGMFAAVLVSGGPALGAAVLGALLAGGVLLAGLFGGRR